MYAVVVVDFHVGYNLSAFARALIIGDFF